MARQNPPRTVGIEENIAQRIASERRKRNLSYERLAKLLTEAGCPIQASAIYKIERARPRRRITVDELVALSTVFETPVEDLLTPMEILEERQAQMSISQIDAASEDLFKATGRLLDAYVEFLSLERISPDVHEYVLGHRFTHSGALLRLKAPGQIELPDVPGADWPAFLFKMYDVGGLFDVILDQAKRLVEGSRLTVTPRTERSADG
jgi:transcriptional regulator with XRE-family HTH domain